MKLTVCTTVCITFTLVPAQNVSLKPHEIPWHNFAKQTGNLHACSLLYGDINAPSRKAARNYIKCTGYASILDVPCGFCTEYFGLQQDAISIAYYGVDIAEKLINLGTEKGLSVKKGSIEHIPHSDSFVDICYARHIFEHISYYEQAMNELIRVAKKEVLIIFSIVPSAKPDAEKLLHGIYFNHYNKTTLEAFCLQNIKVHNLSWQPVGKQEIILHIYLTNLKR